ncbi:hypothetical protein PF008_g13166 [Phytophthora fragariae]|uniref:CCHC-type domain-containing protein n=1 Tax=Phytophthora fragariae TaxID=53985 RepID=A0A6G0RKV2_9STRA|nr:hypothetical protein PF008_g13166 [Phytophthora fragariae]
MMQTGQLESVPSPRKKPTVQRPTPDPQPQPTTPVKTHKPQQPTEPEPTPPAPAQGVVSSEAQKSPKLKDIHCRRFDGKEVHPGLGAGVEDFLNEFESAVRMERLLNQSTWTSELMASVLGTFLEGQASRSYYDFAGDRDINYEELIAHLKKEFGCNLSQYELGKRLDTNKRAGDTWKQYVTYLKFIERLMVGDRSQLLLETVCNNACPELKSTLLSMIDDTSTNHIQELDKVIDFLIRSQGDGRRVGQAKLGGRGGGAGRPQQQRSQQAQGNNKKQGGYTQGSSQQVGSQQGGDQQQQRPNNNQRQGQQRNSASANAAEKTLTCWNCGATGHRQAQCTSLKKNTQQASARQAQQHNQTPESESEDDGMSELWMASSVTSVPTEATSTWLIDSGASLHMCSSAAVLFGTSPYKLVIKVANGGLLHASVKGSCMMRVNSGQGARPVLLHEVHHVPGLDRNLLSVTELAQRGITTLFDTATCSLKSQRGEVIAVTERQGKLWVINGETVDAHVDAVAMLAQVPKATLQHWHERLGHLNFQDLLRMYSKGLASDMDVVSKKLKFCLSCAEAKQTKSQQPTTDTSESEPTDEIGAVLGVDLKTDILPADRNGNKHMLTIVDYGSSYIRVYLLQTKDEAPKRRMDFLPEFERQYGVPVKVIRSDGGGEFLGREFKAYCTRHGVRLQSTLPDTSASNGKVKRMHITLMNSGRAMLWASGLPDRYWGDAVRYASYIRNRVPTRANAADYRAPLDVLTGKAPNVAHILRFGSTCTAHVAHKKAASVNPIARDGA